MGNLVRRRVSDREYDKIFKEIMEEDKRENLNVEDDEDDTDESEYCAAPCAENFVVEKKLCMCMSIAENSSRFSLRVMEAMRKLQGKQDDLLPSTSTGDIVNYIRANYYNDGDLYAQVRTALKQVCSAGFAMELLKDEYHLVGTNAISVNQITYSNDQVKCVPSSVKVPKRRKRNNNKDNDCICETISEVELAPVNRSRRISMNRSKRTCRRQENDQELDEDTPECSCSTALTDRDIDECICENGRDRRDASRRRRTQDAQKSSNRPINEGRQTRMTQDHLSSSRLRGNSQEQRRTTETGNSKTSENDRLNEVASDNVEDNFEELRDQVPSGSKNHEKEIKEWIKHCQEECKRRAKRVTNS